MLRCFSFFQIQYQDGIVNYINLDKQKQPPYESTPAAQPFNLAASAPFAGPYSIPVAWESWLRRLKVSMTELVMAANSTYDFCSDNSHLDLGKEF